MEPVEPQQPEEPVEPVEPVEPQQPEEPVEPVEPVEPQQPEDLGPVTGIEVTERVEELLISWDEFAGADGYRIQWKPQGELEFDHEDTVTGGNTTSYTITGLDPVTEYTVRVIAILSDTESLPVEATGTPLGEETVQPIPGYGAAGLRSVRHRFGCSGRGITERAA